ncbi:MAG: fibronectin type III domain-containing protein [Bacteroidetes bacterium]|nr:fibronectin type III domain-containing protein [Bacteroidota bacterium]
MSTKIATAVMHCTQQQPKKIIERGIKVRDGLYASPLYATPPVTKANYTPLVDAAVTAQGDVKGGGKNATTARNTATTALFLTLEKLLLYVNGLYKGDKDKLSKSGFDISSEPAPHGIPDAPVIKKIENGDTPHSAKIFLAKTTSPLDTQKESVNFIVQMSDDDSADENFKTVLQTKNQHKLVIANLTRGKEEFFRVAKANAKGQSDWSNTVSFIPQ